MQNAAIERVIAAPNLPTLPAVALRVLELLACRDVSVREIASVIEHYPALASKVLRMVNSSFFGLARPCGSVQQALVYIGLHSLKSLVLSFTLARSIDQHDDEVGFTSSTIGDDQSTQQRPRAKSPIDIGAATPMRRSSAHSFVTWA